VPDRPLAWLTTVAHHLIVNHFRKRDAIPLGEVPSVELLSAIEQDGMSDSPEIATMVNGALARMPVAEARLLEAFHFERIKVAQLAATHGISERAIEGRLRRARERLRSVLLNSTTDAERLA
jgi:RNA polymerase sigma factor (sigma-70 family)